MTSIEIELHKNVNNENQISFDIRGNPKTGLSPSIVNAIRRTLLSAIPTVGFKTEMNDSDIIIKTNTTPLHNEYLLHRIGMIPLYIDPESWNKNYLFYLSVSSNNDEPIQRITSNNFTIFPLKQGINPDEIKSINTDNYDLTKPLTDKKKKEIFRPFSWKGNDEYIPITEIKSTKSSTKQKLELYGVPRISVAYEDARWQAVSKSSYSYKKDSELFKKVLKEKIEVNQIPEEKWQEFKTELEISESERYYHRDDNCDPYWYEFFVDSQHFNNSKQLFIKSNEIIIEQLDIFKDELPKITTEEDCIMEIQSNSDELIFKLYVQGFDDTIGNIIQSYIANNYIDETSVLSLCGYKKDHPLEDKIHFTIAFNSANKNYNSPKQQKLTTIIQTFEETCAELSTIFSDIVKEAEASL